MNTFVNAATNIANKTRTTNGMVTNTTSMDNCVDLFYKIGAMRNASAPQVMAEFANAYGQNKEIALRIALYGRDVRGGAGERKVFRTILAWLDRNDPKAAKAVIAKIPELGRWDDIFVVVSPENRAFAYDMLGEALHSGNGLAAKWCPRQGAVAARLRAHFGLTPKQWRKGLVALTDVVEQKMCAKEWDGINFSHVPSVAAARYRKAFKRNAENSYTAYVDALTKGEDPKVKVNAEAVFPYDVLRSCFQDSSFNYRLPSLTKVEREFVQAQWNALPSYSPEGKKILPLIDVSGSMVSVKVSGDISAMQVAVGLGIFLAERNEGAYKDLFLTFSTHPEFVKLNKGDITARVDQTVKANWDGSTDLARAFTLILDVATVANVAPEDMPEVLLILSDMQFNQCVVNGNASALDMIRKKYNAKGYNMPNIVFWNLVQSRGVPATSDQKGVALVSGFSPAIVRSVLSADTEQFTPEGIMMTTIMKPKYDIVV